MGWVALALVAVAAILLDKNVDVVTWATTLDWSWAVLFEATDAHLLVDWLATFAWRWDEDLISSHKDVTLGAAEFDLLVLWTLAWITDAIVLGTALLGSLDKFLAGTVTSRWLWAVFWNTRANLVEGSTALVSVAVLVFGDWNVVDVVNLAVDKVLAVALDWLSAVVWVADALELWATLVFGHAFPTNNVWVETIEHDSSLLTWNAVSSFEALDGGLAFGWFADALSASAHSVGSVLDNFPRLARSWLVVVKWVAGLVRAAASSHWAAVVWVLDSIDKLFSFTEAAWFTGNAHWAVLGNVGTTGGAFAPSVLAAAVLGHV